MLTPCGIVWKVVLVEEANSGYTGPNLRSSTCIQIPEGKDMNMLAGIPSLISRDSTSRRLMSIHSCCDPDPAGTQIDQMCCRREGIR